MYRPSTSALCSIDNTSEVVQTVARSSLLHGLPVSGL